MRWLLRFIWILALVGCRDAPYFAAPESTRKTAPLDDLPNLIVESFRGPFEVAPMECVTSYSIVVLNDSETAAQQTFNVGIYISPDSIITYRDWLLVAGRTAIRGLAAGARAWAYFNDKLHVPAEIPLGQAYLGVLVDELDVVPESDEADNAAARPVNVRILDTTRRPPNLVVTSFNAPTVLSAGQYIGDAISVTVRNNGVGQTFAGFYVGLYLSADSLVTIADTNINRHGPAIDGKCFRCRLTPSTSSRVFPAPWIRVPEDYWGGPAYLGVIVDDRDTVLESDEDDNIAVLRVDVSGPPAPANLHVVSLVGPECAMPGEAIDDSTHLMIRNDGPGDVRSAFQVGLYLSQDAVISASDRRLPGGLVRVDSIETNRIFRVPFTGLHIPTDVATGDMFLGAILDELQEVDEVTTTDNTGWARLAVRERTCAISIVELEIQPGHKNKTLRCVLHDKFTVAILGTEEFDVTQVDHTTLQFTGGREIHWNPKTDTGRRHEKDVNRDGRTDLLLHIRMGDTTLRCGARRGIVTGETYVGERIYGEVALQLRRHPSATGESGAHPRRSRRID
jgi:hypothetical protein